LIAAASVGISLGGAWLCALVSFGVASEDKVRGLNFILGRIVGLVILGLAVATLGFFADLPPLYFVIAFGVLSVLFGFIVIAQVTGFGDRIAGFFRPKKSLAEGNPSSNPNPGPNPGRHHGNGKCGKGPKEGHKMRKFKNSYVFALGVARGATPCLKIMVLVPLLVAVDIYLALAMILVYALTSTIYPVIGYLSGNLLRSVEKHAKYVKVAAAIVLVSVGIYSIINVLTQIQTHGGT
jgi:cytochrome c biogenesis protein CcdA